MTREAETKSEHEYRDWKIRITVKKAHTKFSAMIEVWRPGQDPRSHTGRFVPFLKRASPPAEAQAAALREAEKWIEREMEDTR